MAQVEQTQPKRHKRFQERFEPVMDAEFETVGEKTRTFATTRPVEAEKHEPAKTGLSVFGKKPGKQLPDDSIAFYGFGAALVALSFWISGGHSLFSNIDTMTTAAIQVGSSEIADASWRVVTSDGKTALYVEGIVRNAGRTTAHTQPVTVTVKHKDGASRRYLLGQKGWTLGPGQEVVVSGRLDIGPASIASVVIALSD